MEVFLVREWNVIAGRLRLVAVMEDKEPYWMGHERK